MITYRVLARLLGYPDDALVASVSEMRRLLRADNLLAPAARDGLEPLFAVLESRDLLDLQAAYVGLFDRVRTLSLHLFEHVHGESRDRGRAMIDLVKLYERHGLDVTAKELPDYLPLFLEFRSSLPPAEARRLLAEARIAESGVRRSCESDDRRALRSCAVRAMASTSAWAMANRARAMANRARAMAAAPRSTRTATSCSSSAPSGWAPSSRQPATPRPWPSARHPRRRHPFGRPAVASPPSTSRPRAAASKPAGIGTLAGACQRRPSHQTMAGDLAASPM